MRRIEHRGEPLDGVHPEVRDRERTFLEILGTKLALARPADEIGAHNRDLREGEAFGAPDHRHDEPLRSGDGKTDVRVRMEKDRLLSELGVHLSVAHQRLRGDLREYVGDGHAHIGVALAKPRDEVVDAGHVGRGLELEDRDLPRFGEPARDRLADVRERNPLGFACRNRDLRRGRRSRRRRWTAGLGPLDVLGDDPSFRSGAAHRAEVDTTLPREASRQRRGLDPPVARRNLRCLRRRLLDRLGRLRLLRGCFLRLRRRCLRHVLTLRADEGDRLPDWHLSLRDGDLE